ncbi:MAG: substrate-binding domain-containing protein [Parasporobacterium sp.]|nr:substrate-binding domain-containing protein [Parasporobacterium sp.]
MKKIIAVITVIALCVGILAGCGGQSAPADEGGNAAPQASGAAAPAPAAKDGQIKIGVIVYDTSCQWAKDIVGCVQALADELDVYIEPVIGGTDPNATMDAVQNFGAAGYDGILNLHPGTIMPSLMETCESYEMYMATSNDPASANENYAEYKDSPYWAGESWEDEVPVAKAIVEEMIANGAKKFALHGFPMGLSSQMDIRLQAAKECIESHKADGVELVAEGLDFDKAGAAKNIVDQHPEVDAIFSSVETVSTVYQPLNDAGLAQKVQLNCYDPSEGSLEAMQDGTINYLVTGTCGDSMIAFVLLYNAIMGNKMVQDNGEAASIQMNYLVCKTADDYQTVIDHCSAANPPYTFEELSQFIGEGASYNDLAAFAGNFSLEDIQTRLGK